MDFLIANHDAYLKNKACMRDLERMKSTDTMRYHCIKAVCLSYEMLQSLSNNKRFYTPKALSQLFKDGKITATVKYPDKKHRRLSEWLDPDNNNDSIVYHVKMLAKALKKKEIICIAPTDIDQMQKNLKMAIKVLRKEIIPALDLIFFADALSNLCDWCRDYLILGLSYQTLDELLPPLNSFKNDIALKLDLIDDKLLEAARKQKEKQSKARDQKSKKMSDEELIAVQDTGDDRKEQWNLFTSKEYLEKWPKPATREKKVLEETRNLTDGYKVGGLRRRWYRDIRNSR